MIVVTAFTPSYANHAERLAASLEANAPSQRYLMVAIPKASWLEAVNAKPGVILATMEQQDEDILWIDADAEVLRPLTLFGDDQPVAMHGADFAVFRREWTEPFRTGTVFFANTEGGRALLSRWRDITAETPGRNDQQNLFCAWQAREEQGQPQSDPGGIATQTYWLPIGYCQKIDDRKANPACGVDPDPSPTIIHHMASRTMRHR